jgi:ribonuclease HI
MCSKSMLCWQRIGLWSPLMAVFDINVSFPTNVFAILQHLDQQQKQIFSVTLWSIWKHRNNKVWNNITETTEAICARASSLLTSWRNAQNIRHPTPQSPNTPTDLKWIKPSPGRFTCNVDASFSQARNRVGIGVCIRDDEGRFVLAKTEWMTPLLDVNLGEALGLLSAMYWVRDLQLGIVDFELDSKTVVDSIFGSKSGVSNFSAVINDCRRLLASDLVTSDVRFIRRQANEVAHSFARVALRHASFHIHIRIPSCISTIIMNEMQ